jgi:hypothetical protein
VFTSILGAEVTQFIRHLRGGSQAKLVQASDGLLYVLKFNNNLQGANLPFNEAIGTELYRACGLPVPGWKPLLLTGRFLDQNPECWIQTKTGGLRPAPGICFGSRFLGAPGTRLLEILPETSFGKIRNHVDFWLAWMVDVCALHADSRQAIFIEHTSRNLEAFFVDHGHLFGGAEGNREPYLCASRYLDRRIYKLATKREIEKLNNWQPADPDPLWKLVISLPDEWKTRSALRNFALCLNKLSSQQFRGGIVDMILSLEETDSAYRNHGVFNQSIPVAQMPSAVAFSVA